MIYVHTRTGADVLETLKAYSDELHDLMLRKPHWPCWTDLFPAKQK
jgi:hypothetical protein